MKKQTIVKTTVAAFVLAGSIATVAPAVEAATAFTDVKKNNPYYKAITDFTKASYISGYADGTFKPDVQMTRGQFVTILARALGLKIDSNAPSYFVDMNSNDAFNGAAAAVADYGLDLGYDDGTFKPRAAITRYEAAVMLTKAYNLKSTKTSKFTDVSSAYIESVKAVTENKVIAGTSTTKFGGTAALTRGAAVHAIYTAQQTMKKQKDVELTIYEYNSTSVTTDEDETYRYARHLKPIFSTANKAALEGALITARVQDGQIVDITAIQLNEAYETFSVKNFIIPTLFINANGVRVKNTIIAKNLVVKDEADSKVTLENVAVKGSVTVEEGYGSLELVMKNTIAKAVQIERDDTTIQSNKTLAKVSLTNDIYDVTLNTKVKQLDIPAGSYLDLFGTTTIDEVNVAKGAYLDLHYNGMIKKLNIEHQKTDIYLRKGAYVNKVTIPKNADYTSILSPYSLIGTTVDQISYKGTIGNILAPDRPVIKDPLDESYDAALARGVTGFGASGVKNELFTYTTFGTFNPVRLSSIKIDSSVKLVSGLEKLSGDKEYILNIKRNGKVMPSKPVKLSTLRKGARLSDLTGISTGEILDYKENSQDQWTLEFSGLDEAVVLDLGLLVKNKTYKTARVTLPGKLSEDSVMAEAVKGFTGAVSTEAKNKFTLEAQFGQIYADYLAGKKLDILLKLNGTIQGAKDTDEYTILATRNGKSYAAKKVTYAELKAGKLASAITGEAAKDITSFANNSKDQWSFEIVELFGAAKIDAQLQVGSYVTKTATVSLAGKTAPANFGDAAKATIANFTATATNNRLTASTVFSHYFDKVKLGDATLDTKITFDAKDLALLPAGETYSLKLTQGSTTKTVSVTSDELKTAGSITLSSLLGSASKLADYTAGSTTNWTLDVEGLKHTLNAKLELMAEKDSDKVVVATQTAKLQPPTDLVTAMNAAIKGFTVKATKNIATVETEFGTIDATKLVNAKIDARLQVTNTIPDKTYKVRIKYGATDLGIKEVSYADLRAGVTLSTLLGQPPASLVGHSGKDTWTLEVLNLQEEAKVNADILINNTVIRSQTDITVTKNEAFVMAIQNAITKFEAPTTSATGAFEAKTTFGTIDAAALHGATLDTLVKLTNGFKDEDAKWLALSIQANGTPAVTKFVKVSDLRAGKKLSDIIGSAPVALAGYSGVDTLKIDVLDSVPASLPAGITAADVTKLTGEATTSLQLLVDGESYGLAKSITLGMKFAAIKTAISDFTASQKNNIFTVKTTFGTIRPDDLTDAETLDARVKVRDEDKGKLTEAEYDVDLIVNGTTHSVKVAKQALVDGIKLSSLVGGPVKLKDVASNSIDEWKLVVKNLDAAGANFDFELLIGETAVKKSEVKVMNLAHVDAIKRFEAISSKSNTLEVNTVFTDMTGVSDADKQKTVDAQITVEGFGRKEYAVDIKMDGNSVLTASANIVLDANTPLKLSSILGGKGTLAQHNGNDNWTVEILNPAVNENLTATVDLLIDDKVVRTSKNIKIAVVKP